MRIQKRHASWECAGSPALSQADSTACYLTAPTSTSRVLHRRLETLTPADVTATAPRIRQIEQVQRRADAKPSVSVTVNFTAPQWQEPLRVRGSDEAVSIMRRP